MTGPIHLGEFEEHAAAVLPRMVYDYYAGGAYDEITLRENRDAFDRLRLRFRVLRDARSGRPPRPVGAGHRREEGVVRVLEMLRGEVDLAMALCGARAVQEVTRDLVG